MLVTYLQEIQAANLKSLMARSVEDTYIAQATMCVKGFDEAVDCLVGLSELAQEPQQSDS